MTAPLAGSANRTVVVHGQADDATIAALRSAGLEITARTVDTTVWTPAPERLVPGAEAADRSPDLGAGATGRRLLTVPEAAQALGVGRTTVYELIGAGQLEVVHIGRAVRVPVDAIDVFVEALRGRSA